MKPWKQVRGTWIIFTDKVWAGRRRESCCFVLLRSAVSSPPGWLHLSLETLFSFSTYYGKSLLLIIIIIILILQIIFPFLSPLYRNFLFILWKILVYFGNLFFPSLVAGTGPRASCVVDCAVCSSTWYHAAELQCSTLLAALNFRTPSLAHVSSTFFGTAFLLSPTFSFHTY